MYNLRYEDLAQKLYIEQENVLFGDLKRIVIKSFNLSPIQNIYIANNPSKYDQDKINLASFPQKTIRFIKGDMDYPDNITPEVIIDQFKNIYEKGSEDYEIVFRLGNIKKPFSKIKLEDIFSNCYYVEKKNFSTFAKTEFDYKLFETKSDINSSIVKEIKKQNNVEILISTFNNVKIVKRISMSPIIQKDQLIELIKNNFQNQPGKIFLKTLTTVVEIVDQKAYRIRAEMEIFFISKEFNSSKAPEKQSNIQEIPQATVIPQPVVISSPPPAKSIPVSPSSVDLDSPLGKFEPNFRAVSDLLAQYENNYLLAQVAYIQCNDVKEAVANVKANRFDSSWLDKNILTALKIISVNADQEIIEVMNVYKRLNMNRPYPGRLESYFEISPQEVSIVLEYKDSL